MATATQNAEQAAAIVSCANALKAAKALIDQAVAHGQSLSIDWGEVNALDIAGVTEATPSDVSNATGSLAAFQTLWGAGHGGNFEKLAKAIA